MSDQEWIPTGGPDLAQVIVGLQSRLRELEAERDRLREALERFLAVFDAHDGENVPKGEVDRARRALGGTSDED